jgi:hypothetical protein
MQDTGGAANPLDTLQETHMLSLETLLGDDAPSVAEQEDEEDEENGGLKVSTPINTHGGYPWSCGGYPAGSRDYLGRDDVMKALHISDPGKVRPRHRPAREFATPRFAAESSKQFADTMYVVGPNAYRMIVDTWRLQSVFHYHSSGPASVTLHPELAKKLRVLIYNGDADACVPCTYSAQYCYAESVHNPCCILNAMIQIRTGWMVAPFSNSNWLDGRPVLF